MVNIQKSQDLENRVLSSADSNEGPSENSGKGSNRKSNDDKSGGPNSDRSDSGKDSAKQSVGSQSSNSDKESKSSRSDKRLKLEIREAEAEIEKAIKDEIEEAIENELEDSTPSAGSGRKIRTHFPITVNPVTGEKIVTTPSGVHIVILPDVAIRNMIRAGFPVVLPPEPSPLPSPPEGTGSATEEASVGGDGGGLTLTEEDGTLVYEIPAFEEQNFLGFVPIDIKIKGYVSAETGEIVKVKKSFFAQLIDLISF